MQVTLDQLIAKLQEMKGFTRGDTPVIFCRHEMGKGFQNHSFNNTFSLPANQNINTAGSGHKIIAFLID